VPGHADAGIADVSVSRRVVTAIEWRMRSAVARTRLLPRAAAASLACHRRISRYRQLDEPALRATRKSDTIVIFGSGYSLNDITPQGWEAISAHDTLGFNYFVHQDFVRCDYHLVREVARSEIGDRWKSDMASYFGMAAASPRYRDTIFLVQQGFRAINSNRAIGYDYLPVTNRIFRWRTILDQRMPSESLDRGLTHAQGTLAECVNFAALLGWKTIVLAGVDLYDRRYFWLPRDQPREMVHQPSSVDGIHSTAVNGIVELMRDWRDYYHPRGVELRVYNPRSLLAKVLPVWPAASGDAP
jgi:hypothetical protein